MRTPPILLGAALLFWGWQTELFIVGLAMAMVLESARLFKARWEFTDEEFRRFWIFSILVFFAALLYAFNSNDGPAYFSRLMQEPSVGAQSRAGTAGARTFIAMLRWSPMIFFLFMAAQTYSARMEIPLATISIFLWRKRRRALKAGAVLGQEKTFNISYPYFGACLLAASIHTNETPGYFWGFCGLLIWALWQHRSRRLMPIVWAAVLVGVIYAANLGQRGLNDLQQLITNRTYEWFSQFFQRGANPMQNATAIGQIGRLDASGAIVIRLETPSGVNPPLYLREASYRYYRRQAWLRAESNRTRPQFDPVSEEGTNSGTWKLLPEKKTSTEVNIACYLPGGVNGTLLPLPGGVGYLTNLPAFTVGKNDEGDVLAAGPNLVIFNAHYGPGSTIDGPPTTNDFDIYPNELAAISQIATNLNRPGLNQKQKLQQVQAYFQNNFTYSLWQDGPAYTRNTNTMTPLTRFLTVTHSGHCEYFATATVLLLRQLGIPARYAIGYVVHESKGNKYYVRGRDGHAWVLYWDERSKTWQDFDTTPASRFAEEGKRASPFEWLSDAWSRLKFEIAKFRWGQSELRRYILWALIPIILLLLYQIIFRRKWRRRGRTSNAHEIMIEWPGADSEFYELERRLAKLIGARGPDETFGDWLARAAARQTLGDLAGSIRELLRLHYRYRFDPAGVSPNEREALRSTVGDCLRRLRQAQPGPPITQP